MLYVLWEWQSAKNCISNCYSLVHSRIAKPPWLPELGDQGMSPGWEPQTLLPDI